MLIIWFTVSCVNTGSMAEVSYGEDTLGLKGASISYNDISNVLDIVLCYNVWDIVVC